MSENRSSSVICASVARAHSSGEGPAGVGGVEVACANAEGTLTNATIAVALASCENSRRVNHARMYSSWSSKSECGRRRRNLVENAVHVCGGGVKEIYDFSPLLANLLEEGIRLSPRTHPLSENQLFYDSLNQNIAIK
jgi:hypothetical protein